MNELQKDSSSYRYGLIDVVKTPIGYFTLMIIVIETIIITLINISGGIFANPLNIAIIIAPIIILITIVTLMAIYKPHALYGKPNPSRLIDAHVILTPTDTKRYTKLFDDFTECDFIAFNSPFEVEQFGTKIHSDSLEIHKNRYKKNVKSRYLFFDRTSYEKGRKFFKSLAEKIGIDDLKEHIKTSLWEECPEPPGYTFFVGEKNGKSAIILYPRAVIDNKGIPNAVIYLEGADALGGILRRYFLVQWRDSQLSSAANNVKEPGTL